MSPNAFKSPSISLAPAIGTAFLLLRSSARTDELSESATNTTDFLVWPGWVSSPSDKPEGYAHLVLVFEELKLPSNMQPL